MGLYEKLNKMQVELKAPKGQKNDYGNYKYRSMEDILEAVKPLLKKYKCVLTVTDKIELIGERYYVKAEAVLVDTEKVNEIYGTLTVNAYAREADNKKGMDAAQVTGATSSYARKYALNGLFAIDDTKDADTGQLPSGENTPAAPKAKTITKAQEAALLSLAKRKGRDVTMVTEQAKIMFNKTIKQLEENEMKKMLMGYNKLPDVKLQEVAEKGGK